MNSLKWAVVVTLIAIGIIGNYYYSEQSLLVRVISILALIALAGAIALRTENGRRFWQFAMEARAELRRVTWPTRQETVQTTALVLGVVAIVGMILWGLDVVLLKIVAWLTGYGAS